MDMGGALYTVASDQQVVSDGDDVPLGNVRRRRGGGVTLDRWGIGLVEAGYYLVTVTVVLKPLTSGTVSVNLCRDGYPLLGATAVGYAEAGRPVTLSFSAVLRHFVYDAPDLITLRLGGERSEILESAVGVIQV